jgi:hypothetical protein
MPQAYLKQARVAGAQGLTPELDSKESDGATYFA